MKKTVFFKLILLVTCVVFITSCRKKEVETTSELDAQTKQFNDDANNYKAESDQLDGDVTNALNEYTSFGRTAGIQSSPLCGVTIDTSQVTSQIITFNFDGITPCFSPSRTRSGKVVAQLIAGNHWADAGAKLKLTYINFKVTRLSDNKSITFNGIKTLKNVYGNNWLGLLQGTATHKYQSRAFNVDVLFDNGTHATWNTAYITEWSYTPVDAKITFTATGDTIVNGFSNVSAWGINRNNQNFTTYYNQAILSNTYCGLWRFNKGELVHHVNNADFTLTLGVDQSGNPTPYTCAYGYKVTWTANGNSASVILSY